MTKDAEKPEPIPSPETVAANAPSAEEAMGSPLSAANAALEDAQAQAADYKDKLMRTLAEMENLRKRTEREIADAKAYGITGFARDMLGVADNMQRAFDALATTGAVEDGPMKAFVDGIDLNRRELHKTLEKHGVRQIDPKGEKFDPNLHQAMFEMPDEEVPAGHVAQVVQVGYGIGNRVLRPAMVGVSKGGTKPAPKG